MKARIIRIGNSRGLRLPKPLIEQAGVSDEVDLQIREGTIVISRIESPRAGWAGAAASLKRNGGEYLLLDQHPARFDESGGNGEGSGGPPRRRAADRPRSDGRRGGQEGSAMRGRVTG